MLKILRSQDRGHADHGWLDAYHSFSFADYYDPHQMGFRALRVINEDRVHPKKGFPTHHHDNMEIITYVIEGALAHKDSLGNVKTIKAGEFQAMTAGRGVEHSEYNPSQSEVVHLLQIWILPDNKNLPPTYSEWAPPSTGPTEKLTLVASRIGGGAPLTVHQDVLLFLGTLRENEKVAYPIAAGRHLWLQLISGTLTVNSQLLSPGDGVALSEESALAFSAEADCKFLLFDLG